MNIEGRGVYKVAILTLQSTRGGGALYAFPLLLAFYSKYLEATHTWKFLTMQTFFVADAPMKKK